ncbi:hypothetical protein SAMN05216294_2331 [Flagellimonas zhangzhouensis]|uniref:Uncharacterized protein n=1 Tax=Flagellimonas zhangzhouensis TaxID=1073328 RepID=A0A1H2S841_9FLAO|nr:hypothetical protein SAMN05216294_2331 [Allomuricauda zhangzhouensis]SDW27872.1 hypothetical protein SAMN04487892_0977 [Allomuricauda zhangzhouensis]
MFFGTVPTKSVRKGLIYWIIRWLNNSTVGFLDMTIVNCQLFIGYCSLNLYLYMNRRTVLHFIDYKRALCVPNIIDGS